MVPTGPASTAALRRPILALASASAAAVITALVMWMAGAGDTDAAATIPVKVRWTAQTAAADRERLETQFHLTNAAFDDGTTWRYELTDISTGNIRALVTAVEVEDTANLNRTTYTLDGALDPNRARFVDAIQAGGTAALVVLLGWLAGWMIVAGRRHQIEDATVDALLAGTARDRRIELATALLTLPLVAAIGIALWYTPFPISETVGILEDVQIFAHSFFDPTVRSWYRPLYFSTWRLLWDGSGSLPTALALFRGLEVASVVALIVLFLRCLRPRTWLDAGAACVAVAVLTGTPAFRDNLELPLLMTLVAMPLALVLWRITEVPSRWWHAPAIITIVVVAIGFKEQGLVLVPLVVMAWLAGAPGVTKWTALATTAITLGYLGMRFTVRGTWQPFEQAVGLGFHVLSAGEANARFGAAPLPIYVYNAASTLGNLLLSEPTSGEFRFIRDVLRGEAAPWQFIQVFSSVALTALLAWWSWQALRHRRRTWPVEARLAVALGTTLAASAPLGFNYARDRLGGMALVFLAFAAYHAVRRAAAIAALSSRVQGIMLASLLCVLAGAWQIRAVGTVEFMRYASERAQREWITAPYVERLAPKSATYANLVERLRAQGTDPSVAVRHAYPRWFTDLLGER